jgi:hypothetical protein
MREKLCGDWQWTLNMVFGGVGDAPMESMDRMLFISGNSLGEVGRSVLHIPDLRLVMAPRLVFDMTCSVRSNPSRYCFQCCLALLALRMHMW